MSKARRILLTISAVLASFLVTFLLLMLFVGEEPSDFLIVFILVSLLAVPILTGILVYKKVSVRRTPHVSEGTPAPGDPYPEAAPTQVSTRKKRGSFVFRGKLQLVSGLMGLPQGSICKVRYTSDYIRFLVSGQEFTLDADNMLDVSIMTPMEIQKQYVSSIGGAVAGSMVMGAIGLGALGAIIGGSASQKTIRMKRKYLVITYLSNSETKYLVFDLTAKPQFGRQLCAKFRYLKKNERVQISLS